MIRGGSVRRRMRCTAGRRHVRIPIACGRTGSTGDTAARGPPSRPVRWAAHVPGGGIRSCHRSASHASSQGRTFYLFSYRPDCPTPRRQTVTTGSSGRISRCRAGPPRTAPARPGSPATGSPTGPGPTTRPSTRRSPLDTAAARSDANRPSRIAAPPRANPALSSPGSAPYGPRGAADTPGPPGLPGVPRRVVAMTEPAPGKQASRAGS